MCFLSLLATCDGWINTGANTGNFHSLTFSLTRSVSSLFFFSRLLPWDKPSLGKAIRGRQDMHVFNSVEENTIGDAFFCFFKYNSATYLASLLVLKGYVITEYLDNRERADARAVYICYCLGSVNGTAWYFPVCSLIEVTARKKKKGA